jgi:hypothetical protein
MVAICASAREGVDLGSDRCPLWVKSRHLQCINPCPLYPPKTDMCGALAHVRFGPIADMLTIRSPLRRRERPDRIVNEPALLFLLALNVLHITILNFDAVALTEGTPPSAFCAVMDCAATNVGTAIKAAKVRIVSVRMTGTSSYRKKQFAAGSRPILSLPAADRLASAGVRAAADACTRWNVL